MSNNEKVDGSNAMIIGLPLQATGRKNFVGSESKFDKDAIIGDDAGNTTKSGNKYVVGNPAATLPIHGDKNVVGERVQVGGRAIIGDRSGNSDNSGNHTMNNNNEGKGVNKGLCSPL